MSSLDDLLSKKLQKRKDDNSFRTLKLTQELIDFTSNDYLGLARSPVLYEQVLRKIDSLSIKSNGSAGSRLLSGNSAYAEEVESKLASIFKSEAALIFNSGFFANVSVLSAIPQKNDTILYDELAHASIKDGARLSIANRFNFRHNDLEDLERKLKLATGRKFIAIESIYSMDGDTCPLTEIVQLAERYGAFTVLDEAHSTGVMGDRGSGFAHALGLEQKIDIRVYTFGKAMGCHGACIAGSQVLIDYMINFARPFIYTTAFPIHSLATIDCAFEFLSTHLCLQTELQKKITLFTAMQECSVSKSAIQAIIIPGNDNVRKAATSLQERGFDVRPVLSPTVASGAERLRICLHVYNTDEEITQLASQINMLNTGTS